MKKTKQISPKEKVRRIVKAISEKSAWYQHRDIHVLDNALVCINQILKLDVWDKGHCALYGKLFWEEARLELLRYIKNKSSVTDIIRKRVLAVTPKGID